MHLFNNIAGYAVDYEATTHLLFEGKYGLTNNQLFDTAANNRWNYIYVFKGWEVIVWDGDDGTGTTAQLANTTQDVSLMRLDQVSLHNKPSSYLRRF
jgi:hypothetical protein